MAIVIPKPPFPDEFLVDNRVYTDPQLLKQENERIFLRVWNFVCHESEIPNPGDFRTTIVAGQPIIICRDRSGQVRAFHNTCRHRAAEVVTEPSGNARHFTCLYHLWSYDLDGRLIGVPGIEAYKTSYCPGGLPKQEIGLIPVRTESMHRLVFVCFDEGTPSLAEYLGEVAEELRVPFSSPDLCVEVKWTKRLRANWKMQPENSRDGYHAPLLHKRLRGVLGPPRPFRIFPGGHAVQHHGLDYESGRKAKTLDGILAEQPDLAEKFLAHPLPGLTVENPSKVVTLFPDVLVVLRYSTLIIERQVADGPEETVFETRHVFLKSDTEEVRDIRNKHWMMYWNHDSGNLGEDWAAWEAQQRGVQSVAARYSLLARGEPSDVGLVGDDNRVRAFWKEWRRYMATSQNSPIEGAVSS